MEKTSTFEKSKKPWKTQWILKLWFRWNRQCITPKPQREAIFFFKKGKISRWPFWGRRLRALECLPRYMLLRCRDLLWYPCYVTCCCAAESSGMLATLHVATLQRSPVVSLLLYMLLRCRELRNACHVTCCYAAEISCGILATLHVATLPRSLECLPRYMLLRCRDLWNAWHVACCYAAESSGMLATLHVVVVSHGNHNIERSMYKHMDIDR